MTVWTYDIKADEYQFQSGEGRFRILRQGEPWLELNVGVKALIALVKLATAFQDTVTRLQREIDSQKAEWTPFKEGRPPSKSYFFAAHSNTISKTVWWSDYEQRTSAMSAGYTHWCPLIFPSNTPGPELPSGFRWHGNSILDIHNTERWRITDHGVECQGIQSIIPSWVVRLWVSLYDLREGV